MAARDTRAKRFTVEAGRLICFDGEPFIAITREGKTRPVDADQATHLIADLFNRTLRDTKIWKG